MRELGMPALEFEGWNGLLAPAKTPKAVIARLHREVVAAVRHPDTAVGSSPGEQKAIVLRQMDQFRPVIREMKLD